MRIFIILCLVSQSVFALKTLNKISDTDFSRIYYEDSVAMLDGKLYFLGEGNNIWSSNGTANTTIELQYNQLPIRAIGNNNAFKKINDNIVFINADDKTLWQTDGVNFQQLSNNQVYGSGRSISKQIGDYLVVKDVNENKLVISNGNSATVLDLGVIENVSIDSICVFDQNHIAIVQSEKNIYTVTNNSISSISTSIFTDIETSNFKFKLAKNGECFYQYKKEIDAQEINDFFKFSDNNDLVLIQAVNENIIGWQEMVIFNSDILLFPIYSNFSSKKYLHKLELNSGSAQIIKSIWTSGFFIEMQATDNYFYFRHDDWFGGVRPPGTVWFTAYDHNLEEVALYFGSIPTIVYTPNEDILWNDNDIDTLRIISNNAEETQISAAAIAIKSIIADDDSIYLFGYDRDSSFYPKKSLYKISNNIPISKQLSGLWVDDNFISQGLSVHTGTRTDKTEYMFVSFYIYKEGEPFWVVGNADLQLGESSITIDLNEFKGQSFLPGDIGQDPQKISFGNVILQATNCNNLQATVNILNEEPVVLQMRRINDTTFRNFCSE